MLSGYKTYVVSCGMILYAVGGLVAGYLDTQTAYQIILEALAIAGLRNAIK
jgi:hypothetical protein